MITGTCLSPTYLLSLSLHLSSDPFTTTFLSSLTNFVINSSPITACLFIRLLCLLLVLVLFVFSCIFIIFIMVLIGTAILLLKFHNIRKRFSFKKKTHTYSGSRRPVTHIHTRVAKQRFEQQEK